jgi:hypothetical protein
MFLLWHPDQKKQKATLCLNQSWTFIDLFFLGLYIELDAKAKEQCADSIEEIGFLEVFPTFCPTFSKPNGTKNKPSEVHEWLTHVYSAMMMCMKN